MEFRRRVLGPPERRQSKRPYRIGPRPFVSTQSGVTEQAAPERPVHDKVDVLLAAHDVGAKSGDDLVKVGRQP